MASEQKQGFSRVFWPMVIGLLIIVGIMVFFTQASDYGEPEPAPVEPPSSEWTTAPEGGVEVDLPDTPLRTVEAPAEDASEASEASDQAD